jgi:type II secretory pathway pseudopilin PulG
MFSSARPNLSGDCYNTRLRGADFRFATLRRAEFLNADLTYAIFFDAALEDIQNADLRRSLVNKEAVREFLLTRLNQIHEAFLAHAIQARQSEARTNVGIISRAQQGFYLENGSFAADLERLNLGFNLNSANYQYRLLPLTTPQSDVSSPNTNRATWIIAIPQENNLKSYVRVVWVEQEVPRFTFPGLSAETEVETTFSILCESNQPTTQIPQPPRFINDGIRHGDAQCPKGFSLLN